MCIPVHANGLLPLTVASGMTEPYVRNKLLWLYTSVMASQIPWNSIVYSPTFLGINIVIMQEPHYWPFVRESAGDRGIPLTKGGNGKSVSTLLHCGSIVCHAMTSSNFSHHACKAKQPGPRLNIKTVLSTYGNFHVKDKTAVRTSYL